jgi:hypothetical protein
MKNIFCRRYRELEVLKVARRCLPSLGHSNARRCPFVPAATRKAPTVVESTNQVSRSISPSAFSRIWSCSKMRSKVPSFVQRRYQW